MKKLLLPLLINPFPFRPRNHLKYWPSGGEAAARLPLSTCEILIGGVVRDRWKTLIQRLLKVFQENPFDFEFSIILEN